MISFHLELAGDFPLTCSQSIWSGWATSAVQNSLHRTCTPRYMTKDKAMQVVTAVKDAYVSLKAKSLLWSMLALDGIHVCPAKRFPGHVYTCCSLVIYSCVKSCAPPALGQGT